MTTPAPSGLADSYFLNEVRRILHDQPVRNQEAIPTDAVTGTSAATSKPFRLQRAPLIASGVTLTAPGGAYTVVYDTTPAANQAAVNTYTSEVTFATAPASGTLNVNYSFVTFHDQQILDALTEAMKGAYPKLFQEAVDTSLVAQALQYEYTLPAIFNNPRVVIMDIEYNNPSGITRYGRVTNWERVDQDTLYIYDQRQPGGTYRLHYNVPYLALSDMEVQTQHIPVYGAIARLLSDQEAVRARSTELAPLTGEGGSQPGQSLTTAQYWQQRYEQELNRFARPMPQRRFLYR